MLYSHLKKHDNTNFSKRYVSQNYRIVRFAENNAGAHNVAKNLHLLKTYELDLTLLKENLNRVDLAKGES
jgi:hypothetical protein